MRDTLLFDEYLVRLRGEMLQQSHAMLIAGVAEKARILAFNADLVSRIRDALKSLDADPGQFIKDHLK